MSDPRAYARKLAAEAVSRGEPLAWFETLYARGLSEGIPIPWADRKPNSNLIELFAKAGGLPAAGRALKVGCGLGDDAEWLAGRGFAVTAFDISPSAIAECRRRFPQSNVDYVFADLFRAPADWTRAFPLVLEAYTLQVLPPELREEAEERIAGFVAPGGCLLAVSRARGEEEPRGSMPWPLTEAEVRRFGAFGLTETFFEDFVDSEEPPVRRFRACFRRDAG
ncbi:MAG: tellurite resistance protein TehB [Syntrophaceae bacterium PtaU1.Bin231]|nr:MAG: tellurite resistance protein TehB [Syntrophaceae bacterium PtaU1.Bin231]HOG16679.1 class I SAM-dependent methyltransferase [Syntrophales bacterium]